MIKPEKTRLLEDFYNIAEEANSATLFTTGNGYIGVRGSFEEYGSIRIQGAYIRGVIDEIIEVMEPFADNEYMKKYYIDEDKLKHFEYQDSIINNADFLMLRVNIGGETFYPWEGKILSWERYIDTKRECLVRNVRWENSKGEITDLCYERFSSFDNDHIYCIKVDITPVNHNSDIVITSGIDTRVKTCGQKVATVADSKVYDNVCYVHMNMGKKYGFETAVTTITNIFPESGCWKKADLDGIVCSEVSVKSCCGKTINVEKNVYITSTREEKITGETILAERYQHYYEKHIEAYNSFFGMIDMDISGDELADAGVRFANYHSAISIARNDHIHGMAAKGLTGEKYNNFVWWDSEVYQLPIFIYTAPDAAKKSLMYRYDRLEQSKKNAQKAGLAGAKYAFCSSVNGDEKVWEYARHPFMQVHINADIAWGVIHYYTVTGDFEFLTEYGIKMLTELCEYWVSRVKLVNGRYEILRVTGTDEHHPYVNNDAYTNYLVKYVLEKTTEYCKMLGIDKDYTDISSKMYLPLEKNGLIPQFDGYFGLSRTLEEAGGSNAKSFQMKKSGLYHQSQIIKQPDVMLLFSYLNLDVCGADYASNWDYYEKMCESSSSLSFAPHSICSADNGRMLSAYNYLIETAYIDVYDIHKCAYQGVHSGCLVGAWYAVFRGIAGIVCRDDKIEINPHYMPWWSGVEFNFMYKSEKLHVKMNVEEYVVSTESQKDIRIVFNGREHIVNNKNAMRENYEKRI